MISLGANGLRYWRAGDYAKLICPAVLASPSFLLRPDAGVPMQHIATLLRGANCHRRPFWAKLIFALDRWLQRRGGVFEYSDKSDCIFRVQLSRLSSDVLLFDGTSGHVGDRVIDLHFWNEQIPVPPMAGYSLAWGCAFNRSIEESLRGLAEFLMRKPELSDIRIIRANINLEPLDRIAARHGFEAIRDPIMPSTWERVHQFGENILFFLLVLACNPRGARPKNFSRRRQLLYLSRRVCDSKQLKRSGVCCSANWQSPR